MTETEQVSGMRAAPRRTAVVTFLCIIGFAGAALSVPGVFSGVARTVGDWYPVFLGWVVVASIACMIGMWQMYRLAVYFYAFFALVNQAVMLYMGVWGLPELLAPAAFAGIAFTQVSKMR